MVKEINEKTFELNITNELLNISKSFLWYIRHSPVHDQLPKGTWNEFLNNSIFFGEGLTQKEESTEGYDVSINCKLPSGKTGRLMFLQYKAGHHKNYSKNERSQFNSRNARERSKLHIKFNFNDAAKKKQHIILRNLANSIEIRNESVMYVFPRITKKNDFEEKLGNLIWHSSFVPVLDLDRQAENQKPSLTINEGEKHSYRTSYDGIISEVNYYYYYYYYDFSIINKLIAELICVQIERLAKILKRSVNLYFPEFILITEDAVDKSLEKNPNRETILSEVKDYLNKISENYSINKIPEAPQNYTTKIPKEGLVLEFSEKLDLDTIQYQIV